MPPDARDAPLPRQRYVIGLAVIAAAAFALRLSMTVALQGLGAPPDAGANPDQVDYELFAWQLAQGHGYSWSPGEPTASRAPGTSFVLYPVYWLFGRSFAAARLWFCLISAGACLATAWLAAACFGRRAALAAAAWLALYPGHFYYSMHFLSEVPFGLWLPLACAGTVTAMRRRTVGWNVFAGLFWGLAILTRPQMILILPVGWGLALLALRRGAWHGMVGAGLQTLAIAVVLMPWVARNAVVMGKPTLTTVIGGYAFWGSNNERVLRDPSLRGLWVRTSDLADAQHPLIGDEVARDAQAWRYGMDFVRAHLAEMPELIAWRIYRFVTPFSDTPNRVAWLAFAVGWAATVPVLGVGIAVAWRRDRIATWILLAPVAATLVSVVVFYGSDRFRDALAPAFLVFAGAGAVRLLSWVRAASNPTV